MIKEILTLEEAAELFGVSVKTFIKLLKEETIPARKIGREWRFSRKALIDWLSNGDSQAYSSSEKDTKDFFNVVAPQWDKISKNYYDESISSSLINYNVFRNDMTVVDLGCGNGFISRSIAKYVREVIAVDLSSEMLRELRDKALKENINNITTLESDGRNIPLGSSSIDIVCANMYLHHIENPETAIKEMYRILKPGGLVFIADFHEHNNIELMNKMHDLWPGFKNSDLKSWFNKNGFKKIKLETLINEKKENTGIFLLTSSK